MQSFLLALCKLNFNLPSMLSFCNIHFIAFEGPSEQGNEFSGYIKCENFSGWLTFYQLLKEDSSA
jgi:hypothetical protein